MIIYILLSLLTLSTNKNIKADVFGLAHFIPPQTYSLGVEPETILYNALVSGAGVGVNFKGTYGLSPLSNFIATIGTGTGPKKFRSNATLTFDAFAEEKERPGLGAAVGLGVTSTGSKVVWEAAATFYVHKNFVLAFENASQDYHLEPFLAIPVGLRLADNKYLITNSLTLGSLYKMSQKWSSVLEVGLNIQDSSTYVSGGVICYY
jgi:hypothetical protein